MLTIKNKVCTITAADFYCIYLADIKVICSSIYMFIG